MALSDSEAEFRGFVGWIHIILHYVLFALEKHGISDETLAFQAFSLFNQVQTRPL